MPQHTLPTHWFPNVGQHVPPRPLDGRHGTASCGQCTHTPVVSQKSFLGQSACEVHFLAAVAGEGLTNARAPKAAVAARIANFSVARREPALARALAKSSN